VRGAIVVDPGEVLLDALLARDENMPMSGFLLAAQTACSALHLLTLFLKLEKNWKKNENPSSCC